MQRAADQLRRLADPEHGAPWARRAGTALTIVAILLLASTAAEVTWRIVAPPPSVEDAAPGTATETVRPGGAERAEGSEPPALAAVADHHLFGRVPDEGEAAAEAIPEEAPETRLDLELRGVLALGGEGRGTAIIHEGGESAVYIAGAELPGDATLERVLQDRVILSRDGDFEMLALDRDGLELDDQPSIAAAEADASAVREAGAGSATPSAEAESDARDGPRGAVAREELLELREELATQPSRLTDMVAMHPVMEGNELSGVRVTPRDERAQALFDQAGLEEGDLVRRIDGSSVQDQQALQELVSGLEEASEVALEVERGGSVRQVVIEIEP